MYILPPNGDAENCHRTVVKTDVYLLMLSTSCT